MNRRTALAVTTLVVGGVLGATAPAATAAVTPTARVVYAKLQTDGSVKTRVSLTCPKGSRYSLVVAVTQQFESNGSLEDAVAYSPTRTGACPGAVPSIVYAQTTASDRAPFWQDNGPNVPPNVTEPTRGHVDMTTLSRRGVERSYSFSNDTVMR